jgi:histidyl-tRNA synthetase
VALTAVKGFNDILPGDVERWQHIEATARRVFERYGFAEIRVPILEKTELFCRSIGDATDIVEKEMYSFTDKGENAVTLRPEGTAGVMRAYIEHKLYAQDPVAKLYYMGPMFRYERPQKGRYRQFHQIGAEVTGITDPRIDAHVLIMLTHFFAELGLNEPRLQINSLGCPQCRPAYRQALREFLLARIGDLCEDCVRRVDANPLRALDCKSAHCQQATAQAPSVLEHLCPECDAHFAAVRHHLSLAGVDYDVNVRMVRGLDYYTRTTFELVTGLLGSQSAVAAGGRYDGLVSDLGGPSIPGIGFAMGVERVALLLGDRDFLRSPDLFIAPLGESAQSVAFVLMTDLQRQGLFVETDLAGKSLKSQMRRSDKLRSRYTIILGEDEIASRTVTLREMATGAQRELQLDHAAILAAISNL